MYNITFMHCIPFYARYRRKREWNGYARQPTIIPIRNVRIVSSNAIIKWMWPSRFGPKVAVRVIFCHRWLSSIYGGMVKRARSHVLCVCVCLIVCIGPTDSTRGAHTTILYGSTSTNRKKLWLQIVMFLDKFRIPFVTYIWLDKRSCSPDKFML